MARKGSSMAKEKAVGQKMVGVRRRLYEILELAPRDDRLSLAVNRLLVLLIVVNLAAVVLQSVPSVEAAYRIPFTVIEVFSLIVFTVEYGLRLWVADESPFDTGRWGPRLGYLRSAPGIVDLLAILPFWIGIFFPLDLRALLVFRIVRFLKLVRYSPAMRSLLDALYGERRALFGCFVIMVGIALTSGSLMYFVEREVQPDKFGTIPDAMWWAIVTLGTIGYGDAVPVTGLGRFVGVLTIFASLVMIALPVGIVATAFANEVHRRDFVVTWGMVARVPLFSGLSAREIADIMRLLSAQTVEAGGVIVRRGEPGRSMYFITAGEVEIDLPDQRVRLGVGHFFGEVAVLRRTRRSATATALARSNLLILNGNDLHALMDRDSRLAKRIRDVARDRVGTEVVGRSGDIVSEEIDEEE